MNAQVETTTGFSGNGTTCNDVSECDNEDIADCCVCYSGYSGDGKTCDDIDEHEQGLDNRSDNAICGNSDGGFECVCEHGKTCKDINECLSGESECDANAECINLTGSYTCNSNNGYSGDETESGERTKDSRVDECN